MNYIDVKGYIIAIDEDEKALEMTEMLRQHYPKLKLLVRASGRQMAIQLKKLGVEKIMGIFFYSKNKSFPLIILKDQTHQYY